MTGKPGLSAIRVIGLAVAIASFVLSAEAAAARSHSDEQKLLVNPAKPPAPNAGRVVSLANELRIPARGEGYAIEAYWSLQVDSEGDIFVQDGRRAILRFDSRGRFAGTIARAGESPASLAEIHDFVAAGGRIHVYGSPPAIFRFDADGRIAGVTALGEWGTGLAKLVGFETGAYVFTRIEGLGADETRGPVEIPYRLISVPETGEEPMTIGAFSIPAMALGRGAGIDVQLANVLPIVPAGGGRFFASHKPAYAVTLFDAQAGGAILEFRRPFKRVFRVPTADGAAAAPPEKIPPLPEYRNDINGLHLVDGKLWVQTAVVDKARGVLFDVYDLGGHYLDAFFLKLGAGEMGSSFAFKRLVFAGGCVYFADLADGGETVIRRSRLLNL